MYSSGLTEASQTDLYCMSWYSSGLCAPAIVIARPYESHFHGARLPASASTDSQTQKLLYDYVVLPWSVRAI